MLNKLDITYLPYVPFLLSAIFSLKSFRLKWPKHLQTFSIFLFVTLTLEFFGIAWKWRIYQWMGKSDENYWILNIAEIMGRIMLLWYFSQLLSSVRSKKIIERLIPFYLTFCLINYFFIQKPTAINSYSIGLGSLLVIFFCVCYFIELLHIKEAIKVYQLPEFWIATGTFIYYLCTLTFIAGFEFLARNDAFNHIMTIFMNINDVMMIFMYTLYLIAYLCRPHPKLQYKPS